MKRRNGSDVDAQNIVRMLGAYGFQLFGKGAWRLVRRIRKLFVCVEKGQTVKLLAVLRYVREDYTEFILEET